MLNQKGLSPILLIIPAALGIIIYLLVSSTFPFKDKLFSLLYPKPASEAARRSPGPNQYTNIQQPVEQQTPGGATQPDQSLWVWNRTGCAWDADDTYTMIITGLRLDPGESYTFQRCLIADWTGHVMGVNVYDDERNTRLRVNISLNGKEYVAADSAFVENAQQAKACVWGPEYDRDSTKLQPIPDSNGGVGLRNDVIFKITNIGDRVARKVGFQAELTVDFSNYLDRLCPSGYPIWEIGQCEGSGLENGKICWSSSS